MAKFKMTETLSPYRIHDSARLADGTGVSNQLTDADVGKFVKLAGDSQYGLCAAGNEIEGVVESANEQIADGFYIGSVRKDGRVRVTLDGLQATRRIAQFAPGLPIIGLTAHALPEEHARCLAAGMRECVVKPVDLDLLVAAVLRHTALARARNGNPQEAIPA